MQNFEGFLGKIYPKVIQQVAAAQDRAPMEAMRVKAAERRLPIVNAKERLEPRTASMGVIAEIKRASPSAGALSGRDIFGQAKQYAKGGAAAISVLTQPEYFNGLIGDLADLKAAFPTMPFLRKDFIISEYQIYESKAAGADMVLLIARWLEDGELKRLYELTRLLGMHALVEIENERDFNRAVNAGAEIIGINARNLVDLSVDADRVTELAAAGRKLTAPLPMGKRPLLIGESGVDSVETVRAWRRAGIDVVLVGSVLMKAEHPAELIRRFSLGTP